jgi:hypothetical protein
MSAVSKGHLNILEWAYSHGCPITTQIYNQAIKLNQFVILKWLHANKCPCYDPIEYTDNTNSDIVLWLQTVCHNNYIIFND